MTYNSLFTVLTDPALVDETLTHAIAVAETNDAHLDVLGLGVDRSQTGYYYAGASAVVLQETISRAQNEASEIDRLVRARLDAETIRWSAEKGVAQLADIGRHVAERARFSDLVTLPQPYGDGRGAELEAVPEAALFEGRTPVLVAPAGQPPSPTPTGFELFEY